MGVSDPPGSVASSSQLSSGAQVFFYFLVQYKLD